LAKLDKEKDDELANFLIELSEEKEKEKQAAIEEKEKEMTGKVEEAETVRDQALVNLENVEVRFRESQEKALAEAALRAEQVKAKALVEQQNFYEGKVSRAEADRAAFLGLYTAENRRRKLVHNRLIELQGNIRVYCRVRPVVDVERASGRDQVVTEFPGIDNLSIRRDALTETTFEYDAVFGMSSAQEEVFDQVSPLVGSVMDGYSVCIFAYGQTGTGKTFTMEGPDDNPGVNTRFLQGLLAEQAGREHWVYTLKVSFLEIYNETLQDLLLDPALRRAASSPGPGQAAAAAATPKLEIRARGGGRGGNHVPGLTEAVVSGGMAQIRELMARAHANRAVGSHDMNEHSSRSHAIILVQVEGENTRDGNKVSARLNLIDLAGSERIAKTDAKGDRLKEAQAINSSLSALGDVIAALGAKGGGGASHVPFRNSKLTHLLQDSLSGDSKVMMFVNVSPAEYNITETLCSLNFAARCRNVKLKKGQDTAIVQKCKQKIQQLENELQALRGGGETKS